MSENYIDASPIGIGRSNGIYTPIIGHPYYKGNIIAFKDALYLCKEDTTWQGEVNTSTWNFVASNIDVDSLAKVKDLDNYVHKNDVNRLIQRAVRPKWDSSIIYEKGDIVYIEPNTYEEQVLPAGTHINHLGKSTTYQAETKVKRYDVRLRSNKDDNISDPIGTLGTDWIIDEPLAVVEIDNCSIDGANWKCNIFANFEVYGECSTTFTGMSINVNKSSTLRLPIVFNITNIISYFYGDFNSFVWGSQSSSISSQLMQVFPTYIILNVMGTNAGTLNRKAIATFKGSL